MKGKTIARHEQSQVGDNGGKFTDPDRRRHTINRNGASDALVSLVFFGASQQPYSSIRELSKTDSQVDSLGFTQLLQFPPPAAAGIEADVHTLTVNPPSA
jgi:hypothetical protein